MNYSAIAIVAGLKKPASDRTEARAGSRNSKKWG
jgi:hypothetical protein